MPRRSAFTLVEVLVVISIIALLLAMLLPAMSNARESARRSICGSNLRQASVVLNLYADTNRDWFIPTHWGSMAHFIPNGDSKSLEQYGLAVGANNQINFLSCPSGSYKANLVAPSTFVLNYFYAGGTADYVGNGWYSGNYYGWPFVNPTGPAINKTVPRRSLAEQPSETMLMQDLGFAGDPNAASIAIEWLYWPGIPYLGAVPPSHPSRTDNRLSDGENIQFVDGHVVWRRGEGMTANLYSYWNTLYW